MRGVEGQRLDEVGEGAGDVVAGARVEPAAAGLGDGLDADAVPLPFGGVVGGVEAVEVGGLERVREHHRAERRGGGRRRAGTAGGQPGEEVGVGRREPVPDLLDLADLAAAEVGQRLLGEAGGDADAQAAGDELQEREAAGGVEAVEQALDQLRRLAARGGAQGVDDLAERRVVGRAGRRPDQRDGLGEVADEVVGEREELGVDAGGGDVAQQRRLHRGDVEAAGQRGERPAAVGVGAGAQVVGDQPELGVARRREGEAFEEVGEAAHGAGYPDRGLGGNAGAAGGFVCPRKIRVVSAAGFC